MVCPSPLLSLLRGREERERFRQHVLTSSLCVVQMALNIPGLPKTLPRDREVLERTWQSWQRCFPFPSPRTVAWLDNAAGVALLLGFVVGEPREFKINGFRCEEDLPWGRLLDVDVDTPQGPLSRSLLGVAPRRCFLCEEEAKACAYLGTHPVLALRGAAKALLALSPH